MRRGYILLFLWCNSCERERPFRHIEHWKSPQVTVVRRVNGKVIRLPSVNPTPNIDPDIRLISGVCMVCGVRAMYVITEDRHQKARYSLDSLCSCGLPFTHTIPHLRVKKIGQRL